MKRLDQCHSSSIQSFELLFSNGGVSQGGKEVAGHLMLLVCYFRSIVFSLFGKQCLTLSLGRLRLVIMSMLVSRRVNQQLEGEEMELTNPAQIKNITQYLFNLVKVIQDSGVRDRSR